MTNSVIWKYRLHLTGLTQLTMPAAARVLTVQVQQDEPTLWALAAPLGLPDEQRFFWCVMTGEKFAADILRYIGTLQFEGGTFITHVFEQCAE